MTVAVRLVALIAVALHFPGTPALAEQRMIGYPPQGDEPRDLCDFPTPANKRKKTVRIKINRNGIAGPRNVSAVIENDDETTEDGSGSPLPQPKIPDVAYYSAFDVAMAGHTDTRLSARGDWAYIKIVLGDNMKFYPGKALLVERKTQSALCELQDRSENRNGHAVIRVKVVYDPDNSVTPYNIGILVGDTDEVQTPIFVDPKIKNNG